MSLLVRFFEETYRIVLDSGFFILLGFLLAGILHELVDTGRVARSLGGRSLKSILKAAVVGGPLPLCSCAVVPTALALRKRGASKGATVSFLVSTPETGEEAIALTWGLIDPLMALFRPIAALLTDDRPEVRATAARALGRLGYEPASPRLESLRSDYYGRVRRAAVEALAKLPAGAPRAHR